MINIFNKQETQEILASLHEQFGIKEIPGILLKIGQERIFLYQGSLSENEIKELEKTVFIERLGVYVAKMHGNEVRLSIEGTHVFKDQIIKNTFELNEKQVDEWMKGRELLFEDIKKEKINDKDKNKFGENVDDKKGSKGIILTINDKNEFNGDEIINNKSALENHGINNISSAKNLAKPVLSHQFVSGANQKKPKKGFLIMKYKNDFLGTGKASENKITNFIPKNRRLKEKN